MSRYALASHVFACLDEDQIVLLDLKQDRYFSFDAAKARGLEALVDRWPASSAPGGLDGGKAVESDRIARQLFERGLLIRRNGEAKSASPTITAARSELTCDHHEARAPRSLRNVAAFLAAMLSATIVLRWGSLERAVRRVGKRRERRGDPAAVDIERTRELLAAFTYLRPFLFTSRDECLFESLVLIEFLARRGIFPGWVFGVQSRPFGAHCWVQQGDIALNDTLEHLARYTPIMAV